MRPLNTALCTEPTGMTAKGSAGDIWKRLTAVHKVLSSNMYHWGAPTMKWQVRDVTKGNLFFSMHKKNTVHCDYSINHQTKKLIDKTSENEIVFNMLFQLIKEPFITVHKLLLNVVSPPSIHRLLNAQSTAYELHHNASLARQKIWTVTKQYKN